ncbi:hypothetical protein AOCH_002040 [Aspergillus ochraceoroseus]|nr:hypothetical protein AOCH_002040 [Aspergillus ochraceoroseus]
MRVPHPPDHGLFQFLRAAVQVHQRFVSGALSRAESPIYVIGNPSADLDSIVSALVYSYFANNRVPCDNPRPHVPVINLEKVPAGPELRRLRPEFAKALWLSGCPGTGRDTTEKTLEVDENSLFRDHFLTVADFATHLKQEGVSGVEHRLHADSVLVDWNALPIRSTDRQPGHGSLVGLSMVEFNVLGCIDHHTDERFLPTIAPTQPYLVEPTGSCTSHVVNILETMGLWERPEKQDSDPKGGELSSSFEITDEQMARLAVAPILIDTANLSAKDKVTEFDTAAYDFLLPKTNQSLARSSWDPNTFYMQVNESKQNSLELLTVDEILDRDYKEWAEKTSQQTDTPSPIQIGICSMVKSIPWIVRKAGGPKPFLQSLQTFATNRKLDIVVVMTAFSSAKDGQFSRELLVCALNNQHAVDALQTFLSEAGSRLGLEEWSSLDGDDFAQDIKDTWVNSAEDSPWIRIWTQTNVAQSRKQVAPLIRGAVASL